MSRFSDPKQIGEILRELFIIRPDGSVDHDLVVAYARADSLSEELRVKSEENAPFTLHE